MSKQPSEANLFDQADCEHWLTELKQRIYTAQTKAALSVNRELILLYWKIGQDILSRQQRQG
jgi:hypothetical protein